MTALKRVELVLPGERPPSWNNFYSSNMHWTERRDLSIAIHNAVRWQLIAQGFRIQNIYFKNPVKIICKVYFKSNPYDCSNIPVKLYEDGLKDFLIADDGPNYVKSVETISLIDKAKPRVELIIEEVELVGEEKQQAS